MTFQQSDQYGSIYGGRYNASYPPRPTSPFTIARPQSPTIQVPAAKVQQLTLTPRVPRVTLPDPLPMQPMQPLQPPPTMSDFGVGVYDMFGDMRPPGVPILHQLDPDGNFCPQRLDIDLPRLATEQPRSTRVAVPAQWPQVPAPSAQLRLPGLPEMRLPQVATQQLRLPQVDLPEVRPVPQVATQQVRLPPVNLPVARLPQQVQLPQVNLPQVNIPKLDLPYVGLDVTDPHNMKLADMNLGDPSVPQIGGSQLAMSQLDPLRTRSTFQLPQQPRVASSSPQPRTSSVIQIGPDSQPQIQQQQPQFSQPQFQVQQPQFQQQQPQFQVQQPQFPKQQQPQFQLQQAQFPQQPRQAQQFVSYF